MNNKNISSAILIILLSAGLNHCLASSGSGQVLKITVWENNIRSGPSTSYPVIGICKKGETYDVIEIVGSWYEIKYSWAGGENAYTYYYNGELINEPSEPVSNSNFKWRSTKKNNIIIRASKTDISELDKFSGSYLLFTLALGGAYYGYTLMETGLVVLGRDIMIGSPALYYMWKTIKKRQYKWGTLDQLEVKAELLDQSNTAADDLIAGDVVNALITITNRGQKPVKGISPQVTMVSMGEFGRQSNLIQGIKTHGEIYSRNEYQLKPGEKLTVTGIAHIPIAGTEVNMSVFLSDKLTGKQTYPVKNLSPPHLLLSASQLNDQDGNEILDGLETADLTVQITNQGDGPAKSVRIKVLEDNKHLEIIPVEISVGSLVSGQSSTVEFKLKADRNIEKDTVLIRIAGTEVNGFDAKPLHVKIPTAAVKPPIISIDYWSIHDGFTGLANGNDNRMIENGETVEILIEVKNSGDGPAYGVQLIPDILGGPMPLSFSIPVGLIAPSASVTANLGVNVPIDFTSDILTINAIVTDERGFINYKKTIDLESYYRKPELDFDYAVHDGTSEGSKGNQNGIIENGEQIEIEILPQNMGELQAEDVSFSVTINYPGIRPTGLSKGKWKSIGRILPNSNSVPIKYPFMITWSAKPGTFQMIVEMEQSVFSGLKRTITLDLEEEKIEAVQFGTRTGSASGFGKFGSSGAAIINVDVAPNLGKTNDKAVAVVIGNRKYRTKGVPIVEYAERDARIFRSYLTRTLGIRNNNIISLTNASYAQFREVFGTEEEYKGKLFSRVKKGYKVFIFYSGHGAPDVDEHTAYFVPTDCNPSEIKLTGYPVDLMLKNLAKLPTDDVTVVVDACFSGKTDQDEFLIKDISPALLKLKNPEVIKGISFFSASEKDQVSSWYREGRHGVFTYFFLAGMLGHADKNEDNKVSYGEMDAYLKEKIPDKVSEISSGQREQNPTFNGDESKILVKY